MLTPLPADQWDARKAAHLLNRAGFGGLPEEIEMLRARGLQASVRLLVDEKTEGASAPPLPEWAHPRDLRETRVAMRTEKQEGSGKKEVRREFRQMEGANIVDLRRWWLERMSTTPAPLVEKMTLFWHGHFATSVEKVKDGYWMARQNQTLRRFALGSFAALTKEMSRDPAMMIYLDLQRSDQAHPNENWSRELMELFTVGIGHYSEQDIRESARAFTGYRLDLTTQQFRFAPRQQDLGQKTFMGRTGSIKGDEIIDILLQQPACASFLARKLWRFFVEDAPSEEIVQTVARRIRAHNFEMRPVMREIFSSAEFYAEDAIANQVKSPVQFLVQTTRLLGTELPAPQVAQNAMRQMGQILFAPPNVKGWDGGKSWVSTSTLLFRYNFANYLINGDAMRPTTDPGKQKGADLGFRKAALTEIPVRAPVEVGKIVPAALRDQPEKLLAHLAERLFQAPMPEKERAAFLQYLEARKPDTSDATMRGLLHLMTSTPQFQLA